MRKRLSVITLLVALMFVLCGCFMTIHEAESRPFNQPNTKWETADGTIKLSVNSERKCFGEINVNGTTQKVFLAFGLQKDRSVYIYDSDDYWDGDKSVTQLGRWVGYYSETSFVAVVKESTFFEEGQEFTFYRIDE